VLFTPEAHEALADEPWSAERAGGAIASIVADAESAFDEGWDAPAGRGRRRYTLWTGDLGTALYLADCIDGGGQLPLP
jgi:hypothetical protein